MKKNRINKAINEDYSNEIDGGNVNLDNIEEILNSYLETLIWSSSLEDESENSYTIHDIDETSIIKSKRDIVKFINLVSQDEEAIEEMNTYDEKSFGHYLALSRNGHGSGFFDDYNDKLQDLARSLGQADLYVGDDDKLHIMGDNVNENRLKLKRGELKEMISRVVNHVLSESSPFPEDREFDSENDEWAVKAAEAVDAEGFTPQGTYTVSNTGGYEIMISDDGEMARVRDAFGSDNPEVSDWLPIEYIETDELDDDGYPETEPVIDPNGYNIPLSQVIRTKNFYGESNNRKKFKLKLSEFKHLIKDVIKEELEMANDNNRKDYDVKEFSFEVYVKNPETGEDGWDIQFVSVIAETAKKAIDILKLNPLFDTVITIDVVAYLSSQDLDDTQYEASTVGIWSDKPNY